MLSWANYLHPPLQVLFFLISVKVLFVKKLTSEDTHSEAKAKRALLEEIRERQVEGKHGLCLSLILGPANRR